MEHAMVDLETLGQRPGCSILSIGAVAFDQRRGLGTEFYVVVNRESCKVAGLHEDESTLRWWGGQSQEAAQVLKDAETGVPLGDALEQFTKFLAATASLAQIKVWGNGSDFDNAILACAYAAIGRDLPWKFWNNRCYRTVKSFHPEVKINRAAGVHHNALFDAKNQADHLLRMLRPVRALSAI